MTPPDLKPVGFPWVPAIALTALIPTAIWMHVTACERIKSNSGALGDRTCVLKDQYTADQVEFLRLQPELAQCFVLLSQVCESGGAQ